MRNTGVVKQKAGSLAAADSPAVEYAVLCLTTTAVWTGELKAIDHENAMALLLRLKT
jgi:hypothetical protein